MIASIEQEVLLTSSSTIRPAQGASDSAETALSADSGALQAAPVARLVGVGESGRRGNSAASEADATKLLLQFLALGMPDLLGVPAQSDASISPELGHDEAITALTALDRLLSMIIIIQLIIQFYKI